MFIIIIISLFLLSFIIVNGDSTEINSPSQHDEKKENSTTQNGGGTHTDDVIENGNEKAINNKGDGEQVDATTSSTLRHRRNKRKSKSKYSNMEHDDLEKMLQWKNGIGYLKGMMPCLSG